MGLSLCYELRLPGDAAEARECLLRLHEFAQTQSFAEVNDLVELRPPDISADEQDELSGEQQRLLTIFGSQYGQKKLRDGREVWIDIPPQHVLAFSIHPAEGAEFAQFGLASHPAVIERQDGAESLIIETGLTGRYSWTQCCKTQYAGLQQHGGFENFRAAHVGLVNCLDFLAENGVQVEVRDDSGYWEHRDEDQLRKSLTEWNGLIAAFAGQMKDRLGADPEVQVSAPILTAPDFEHLEAKGLDEWTRIEDDDAASPQ